MEKREECPKTRTRDQLVFQNLVKSSDFTYHDGAFAYLDAPHVIRTLQ